MSALAPKPFVGVVWDDAHAVATGDYTEADIARDVHAPVRYTSFGLLVQQDAAGITIASEFSGDTFRGLSFVPAGMIVEVVQLGVLRGRRPRAPREVPSC